MSCLPFELTLVSAHGLKNVNLITKMDVYAVVEIVRNPHSEKQKTPVDNDCGTDPRWNYTMRFTISETAAKQNRLVLEIKIKSHRSLGDRDIGEVRVPVKELLDSYGGDGDHNLQKSVSYSVRSASGKTKGTLELRYKFGEKFTLPKPDMKPMMPEPKIAYPPGHPVGYPAQNYPPATVYPPGGYQPQLPPHQYPPPQYPLAGGYPAPPVAGYGYPPPAPSGYGYGYGGYPPVVQPQKPPKRSGLGGVGMGLGAGLLGGLLVGEMIDGVSDASAYDAGYDAGFDDGGGFDF